MAEGKESPSYMYTLASLNDTKAWLFTKKPSDLKTSYYWFKTVDCITAQPRFQLASTQSRNCSIFNYEKIVLYDINLKQYYVAAHLPDTWSQCDAYTVKRINRKPATNLHEALEKEKQKPSPTLQSFLTILKIAKNNDWQLQTCDLCRWVVTPAQIAYHNKLCKHANSPRTHKPIQEVFTGLEPQLAQEFIDYIDSRETDHNQHESEMDDYNKRKRPLKSKQFPPKKYKIDKSG